MKIRKILLIIQNNCRALIVIPWEMTKIHKEPKVQYRIEFFVVAKLSD